MQNMFRLVGHSVSELESALPDMVDAAETEKERQTIRAYLNRLAILVNESRRAL